MNIKHINKIFKVAFVVGIIHSPFAQSAESELPGAPLSHSSIAAQLENGFNKVGFRARRFHNSRSFGRFGHRRGFSGLGHRSFGKFRKNGFGYYGRFRPKFGFRNYRKSGYRGYF